MSEFTAPSGAQVVINLAPWKDAKALKMAIERNAAQTGLNLSTILVVDGSPEVDALLQPCLIRCLRNGEKITESTFDAAEARKDYYDIVIACVKENLGPLAERLNSELVKLGILTPRTAGSPASK